MPCRRFELTEGKSSKFWEINQRGKQTRVCFGRIGTNGQTREKEYDSTAAAKSAMTSLIAQKVKKGYLEITKSSKVKTSAKTKSKSTTQNKTSHTNLITSAASIPKNETFTMVGLVDPSMSGGGVKNGRAKLWTFVVGLIAWKINDGPVVNDRIDVMAPKVNYLTLSKRMKQFEAWKSVRLTVQRSKRQTRPQMMVDLIKFQGESQDKNILQARKKLSEPIEIRDRTFGTIRFNRENRLFEGEIIHQNETFYLEFDTESIEEAKTIIKLAKPLWRSRKKWFKEFHAFVFDKLFDDCQRWRSYVDADPLTADEFKRLLDDPYKLEFRLRAGKLEYEMHNCSEELFFDHGLRVYGSSAKGLIDAYCE